MTPKFLPDFESVRIADEGYAPRVFSIEPMKMRISFVEEAWLGSMTMGDAYVLKMFPIRRGGALVQTQCNKGKRHP